MKHKLPLVSIVILHFNRIHDLKETIKKSLEIKYGNLEYIVIDNGSKKEIKAEFKNIKFSKIKKINIPKNKGSAYGHTIGMQEAKGKYILTIDDDSYVSINSISYLVDLFENNEKLGAVGLGMVNPNTNYNDYDFKKIPKLFIPIDYLRTSFDSMIATSAAFFRKKCLVEVNYYDLNWNWYTEDTELVLKIISKGYNTINLPQIIAYHKSSLVNRNFDLMSQNSIEGTILLYFKFFPLSYALYKYSEIISRSIYNSIYNFNFKYLTFAIVSPKKIISVLSKYIHIDPRIRKNLHIPGNAIFSRK